MMMLLLLLLLLLLLMMMMMKTNTKKKSLLPFKPQTAIYQLARRNIPTDFNQQRLL
jgi:hypothetical protein